MRIFYSQWKKKHILNKKKHVKLLFHIVFVTIANHTLRIQFLFIQNVCLCKKIKHNAKECNSFLNLYWIESFLKYFILYFTVFLRTFYINTFASISHSKDILYCNREVCFEFPQYLSFVIWIKKYIFIIKMRFSLYKYFESRFHACKRTPLL